MSVHKIMEGCWKCVDRTPRADESRLLCNRCSLLNVGPGSTDLTTFGIYRPESSADNATLATGAISTSAHQVTAPVCWPGPISRGDWTLYPPESNLSGETLNWRSDQIFISADGHSAIEEPAKFSIPAFGTAPLDSFDYQATTLESNPSLFLYLPHRLEAFEGLSLSLTHQHVINAREEFEISRKPSSVFQHEQYNVGSIHTASSMSYGQHSLYQALLSLEYTCDESTTRSLTISDSSAGSPTTTQPPPNTCPVFEAVDEKDDPEGIEAIVCGVLPLAPRVESNFIPFVLQSYANWMKVLMFDPSQAAYKMKDHIIRRCDRSTQSRFRMMLTANLLRAVIVLDDAYKPTLSLLTNEVRQTLVQSRNPAVSVPWDFDVTLSSPLDFTLELNLFFLFGPPLEGLQVMSDIALVLRRMYGDPTSRYIHLPSLLAHSDTNVRGYPAIDVLYSMLTGLPTQLKYDTTPRRKSNGPGNIEPLATWLIGQPSELTLVLARIGSLHDEFGVDVDPCIIDEIESDIRDFKSDPGTSVDPSLTVTRLVVLEAWRQVGYINLYMRLCGESALGPRVRAAQRRLVGLVAGTKSSHRVNMHLASCLGIAGVATTQADERNLILTRLQSVWHARGDSFLNCGIQMLRDIWTRTDSEGRPSRWSDLRIATRRIIGI